MQKVSYEMCSIDWSSDVCSYDLIDLSIWSICSVVDLCRRETERRSRFRLLERRIERQGSSSRLPRSYQNAREAKIHQLGVLAKVIMHCTKSIEQQEGSVAEASTRSEDHTPELQSLMRISYAVFCLKQKKTTQH